ncbi:hypothetical protein BGX26_004854 [Mortierella sp. AD094]|nr:hypothetical protein BGX26_004854 [Mortierella sp. AD094]
MNTKPASKFSLDSLMSRVLPPLDINVPPTTDGSKKFKRVRPVEGAVATATTTTTTTTAATSTTATSGYVSMNPTVTPASAIAVVVPTPTATASIAAPTSQKPNVRATLAPSSKPYIPSDMAAAAASIFAVPAIVSTPTPASAGKEASTESTAGTTKKGRRANKKRKGGQNNGPGSTGAVASDAAGSIQIPSQGGATLNKDDPSGISKPQQKNNRKRKKGQNNNNNQNANNEEGSRSDSKQQYEGRNKKIRRKNDPQLLVRNLDATPELVGVSTEDDFSTLLVKHVEHSNKMLQRDLEKQSKMMMEEQKKQAKLLATQAAQLSDPQAAQQALEQQQKQQQQQQQQQQKKHPQNKNKTPFVPRKDCIYFLRGFCRNEKECTFRHDVEARNAHQAQLSEAGSSVADTTGAGGADLAQVAMYAM